MGDVTEYKQKFNQLKLQKNNKRNIIRPRSSTLHSTSSTIFKRTNLKNPRKRKLPNDDDSECSFIKNEEKMNGTAPAQKRRKINHQTQINKNNKNKNRIHQNKKPAVPQQNIRDR